MKALILALFMVLTLPLVEAQEQLALRLNEPGIMKVLQMALKYNTAKPNTQTVVIPGQLYNFTVKKENLLKNPVIKTIQEISDLDLSKDFPFYFQTAPITITGQVDPKSLKASIINSRENGFDLKLFLKLPKVSVKSSSMSICEFKQKGYKRCEDHVKNGKHIATKGLKAYVENISLHTTGRPVEVTAILRLTIDKGIASLKVRSVDSNLDHKYAPGVDFNFNRPVLPPLIITINGQSTELDTSGLKDKVLKHKVFLGKRLLTFAADFITNDLAEMINLYLVNTQVATNWEIYKKDANATFKEFVYDEKFEFERFEPVVAARDATYVKQPIFIEPKKDFITIMLEQITEVIRQARVDLSLKSIKTPTNKDIELAGLLSLILNHDTFQVRNTLGNSNRRLPTLDLAPYRRHHVNLAISEPVINGALDLINSTGLFSKILKEMANVPGLYLNDVKLHFTPNKSLAVIINVVAKLSHMRTSILSDPLAWGENQAARFLEMFNTNGTIYFPIEVEVIPQVVKQKDGSVKLNLQVKSPIQGGSLRNTFGYSSNVDKMNSLVRDGLIKKLGSAVGDLTGKTYNVDLSKFLNRSGVEFTPKEISFLQEAYMLINLDIKDINFNSLNPNKK